MLSASASNLKMELSPIFLFLDIFEILGTVLFIGTFLEDYIFENINIILPLLIETAWTVLQYKHRI